MGTGGVPSTQLMDRDGRRDAVPEQHQEWLSLRLSMCVLLSPAQYKVIHDDQEPCGFKFPCAVPQVPPSGATLLAPSLPATQLCSAAKAQREVYRRSAGVPHAGRKARDDTVSLGGETSECKAWQWSGARNLQPFALHQQKMLWHLQQSQPVHFHPSDTALGYGIFPPLCVS